MEGISYVTSLGVEKLFGKLSSSSFKYTFDNTYSLMGLYGSYSATRIDSLGVIRMNSDCPNFIQPSDEDTSDDTKTKLVVAGLKVGEFGLTIGEQVQEFLKKEDK